MDENALTELKRRISEQTARPRRHVNKTASVPIELEQIWRAAYPNQEVSFSAVVQDAMRRQLHSDGIRAEMLEEMVQDRKREWSLKG